MYFIQQSIQSLIGKLKVKTYPFTRSTQTQCNTSMFIKTLKKKDKNSYQHSSGKDKGFGMAKATEVLNLEAPEGN